MPYVPNTPESLLPRSDSKNPSSTCSGTTSSGRPCRRSLASPKSSSHSYPPVLNQDSYCWQHKDQAPPEDGQLTSGMGKGKQGKRIEVLKERTSVDTLAERLGLLDVEAAGDASEARKMRKEYEVQREERRHKKTTANSLPSHSNGYANGRVDNGRPAGSGAIDEWNEKLSTPAPRPVRKKEPVKLFCCFGTPASSSPRPRPRPVQPTVSTGNTSRPPQSSRPNLTAPTPATALTSHTQRLLSLIPKTLSPQTTSLLLAELSKPPSESDEEGYIYIFWLTPESLPISPVEETARGLLEVPGSRPDAGAGRRTSEILRSFSTTQRDRGGGMATGEKTDKILLKIGRANNVMRRMNEWKRQCGYNLSLIRYYPYLPSTPSTSPAISPGRRPPSSATPSTPMPRKVPHAHKVERLVHIELGDLKARESGKCDACGREHREWFEVEAKREAVKMVDGVVRRWVEWSLGEFA